MRTSVAEPNPCWQLKLRESRFFVKNNCGGYGFLPSCLCPFCWTAPVTDGRTAHTPPSALGHPCRPGCAPSHTPPLPRYCCCSLCYHRRRLSYSGTWSYPIGQPAAPVSSCEIWQKLRFFYEYTLLYQKCWSECQRKPWYLSEAKTFESAQLCRKRFCDHRRFFVGSLRWLIIYVWCLQGYCGWFKTWVGHIGGGGAGGPK